MSENPFFGTWNAPFETPPFDAIEAAHFPPAFERAMAEHAAAAQRVAEDPAPASFANTIEALEIAMQGFERVGNVFGALAGAHTNDALQAVEREMAPKLARHFNEYFLNAKLFARIKAAAEDMAGLNDEQKRLIERYLIDFRRSGAELSGEARKRYAGINERLASLSTAFGQNVLADERDFVMALDESDLAGLPEALVAAARGEAEQHGLDGRYAITLSRSSVEPFLTYSARRDLREKAWRGWVMRGENGGKTDNAEIMTEEVALRAEAAALLGYKSHAEYVLADRMAKTPEVAMGLMREVWAPARTRAEGEAKELQELIREEGGNFALEPWDWRYYAEKLRKARYDVDEAEVKPYLVLDRIIEAAFYVAGRLFGLSFNERKDIPLYHPDVRVWEVCDQAGRHIALFYGDYFARASKRSGAWMTAYRGQSKLGGAVRPLITNVCNFAKPAKGEPALLSLTDVCTLFHEFGHGLHGMLSDVTYPSLAGTAVPTDFVELPSQLYEHWAMQPEILSHFARHAKTGEPMPQSLIDKIEAARRFQQGFETVEFLGSAFIDMDVHSKHDAASLDLKKEEAAVSDEIGMPREIVMRHRPPHFQHIFSGGYSAGYYSYLWSAMLDNDGFEAFTEAGDIFAPEVAERLKRFVYSAGNLRDAAEAYRAFRGRDPSTKALLKERGFAK